MKKIFSSIFLLLFAYFIGYSQLMDSPHGVLQNVSRSGTYPSYTITADLISAKTYEFASFSALDFTQDTVLIVFEDASVMPVNYVSYRVVSMTNPSGSTVDIITAPYDGGDMLMFPNVATIFQKPTNNTYFTLTDGFETINSISQKINHNFLKIDNLIKEGILADGRTILGAGTEGDSLRLPMICSNVAGADFEQSATFTKEGSQDWEYFEMGGKKWLFKTSISFTGTNELFEVNVVADTIQLNLAQTLTADQVSNAEYYTTGGKHFLLLAKSRTGGATATNSLLYSLDETTGALTQEQTIASYGAKDWHVFTADGNMYALLTNHFNNGGNGVLNSPLYSIDATTGLLTLEQDIYTEFGSYWETYEIGGNTFAVVTNTGNLNNYVADSKVYQFDTVGDSLVEVQSIPTVGAWDVTVTELTDGNLKGIITQFYNNVTTSVNSLVFSIDATTGLWTQVQTIPTLEAQGVLALKHPVNDSTYVFIANLSSSASLSDISPMYVFNPATGLLEFVKNFSTDYAYDMEGFVIDDVPYVLQGGGYRFTPGNKPSSILTPTITIECEEMDSLFWSGLKSDIESNTEKIDSLFNDTSSTSQSNVIDIPISEFSGFAGFVGQPVPVFLNSATGDWELSQADTFNTLAEALVVGQVGTNVKVATDGFVEITGYGGTAGLEYYTSQSVAGVGTSVRGSIDSCIQVMWQDLGDDWIEIYNESGACGNSPNSSLENGVTDEDGDTKVSSIEGATDAIQFTVDGIDVGSVTTVGGTPKWNLNGVVDPIVFAWSESDTNTINVLSPQVGWVCLNSDSLYYAYNGTNWELFGATNSASSNSFDSVIDVAARDALSPNEGDIIATDYPDKLWRYDGLVWEEMSSDGTPKIMEIINDTLNPNLELGVHFKLATASDVNDVFIINSLSGAAPIGQEFIIQLVNLNSTQTKFVFDDAYKKDGVAIDTIYIDAGDSHIFNFQAGLISSFAAIELLYSDYIFSNSEEVIDTAALFEARFNANSDVLLSGQKLDLSNTTVTASRGSKISMDTANDEFTLQPGWYKVRFDGAVSNGLQSVNFVLKDDSGNYHGKQGFFVGMTSGSSITNTPLNTILEVQSTATYHFEVINVANNPSIRGRTLNDGNYGDISNITIEELPADYRRILSPESTPVNTASMADGDLFAYDASAEGLKAAEDYYRLVSMSYGSGSSSTTISQTEGNISGLSVSVSVQSGDLIKISGIVAIDVNNQSGSGGNYVFARVGRNGGGLGDQGRFDMNTQGNYTFPVQHVYTETLTTTRTFTIRVDKNVSGGSVNADGANSNLIVEVFRKG